jgi:hypothetical protein
MMNAARTLASLGLAGALFLSVPARAEAPVTIAIEASGELSGFRIQDASPYLASTMEGAGLAGWHFIARDPGHAAPDRIEWRFTLLPYAGGEVRRFFPMRETGAMDLHLGSHRLIAAEAKLYLNGEYQTATFGQEAIQGDDSDPDLAAFLVKLTRNLENGYKAIDMAPAVHRGSTP